MLSVSLWWNIRAKGERRWTALTGISRRSVLKSVIPRTISQCAPACTWRQQKWISLNLKKGSHPKTVVGTCSVWLEHRKMRLSLCCQRRHEKQAVFSGKTALPVVRRRGARVARKRCPILREGTWNIYAPAGGCKALNAIVFYFKRLNRTTTEIG